MPLRGCISSTIFQEFRVLYVVAYIPHARTEPPLRLDTAATVGNTWAPQRRFDDGTGVGIGPSPLLVQWLASQTIQTPSQAEHSPGGRFASYYDDEERRAKH